MAVITKIRERSGLVIGVITLALVMFVATEYISKQASSGSLFGGDENNIGEIAGEKVPISDFQNKVEELKSRYAQSLGRQPNEGEMPFIRKEAWNELVYERAFQKDFEELGIMITDEELVDMIQGNNIDPRFAQRFINPETGEIDRNQIVGYLKTIQSNPQQYAQDYVNFALFEQSLKTTRPRDKYAHLFVASTYVTKAEAKREYEEANTNLKLKYAFVPFSAIPNEQVKPTEEQLKAYYEAHKADYEREARTSIEYVPFPLNASSDDSTQIKKDITSLMKSFQEAQDDTAFVAAHSDVPNNFNAYFEDELPNSISVEEYTEGKIIGPLLKEGAYTIYKMTGIIEQEKPYVKARHILFETRKETTEEERTKIKADAEDILKRLTQDGLDFAYAASQYSADPGTSTKGGDLGWFTEGAMVPTFNDAVMAATQKGIIPRLVESDFGYHIIKVEATKTTKQYGVAKIVKRIEASEDTRETAYQLAGEFAQCQKASEYVDKVKKHNKISLQALNLEQDDSNINNLTGTGIRDVIKWAFKEEVALGQVSEVFELEDQYIVALLSERQEAGIAPLEKVKQEVTAEVVKELKAKMIADKIKGKAIEQISSVYEVAVIETAENVNFKNTMLKGVGGVSYAIGKAFAMKEGETSAAITETLGVIMLKVEEKAEPAEVENYDTYVNRLVMPRAGQMEVNLMKAIKEVAEVKDKIAKYY